MKNVVLTFDDCYDSHLIFVKPLLDSYKFRATFFVSGYYLDRCKVFHRRHLKDFENDGFELGNHLYNHIDMTKASVEDNQNEITHMNQIFRQCGLQEPVSFAYPGFHVNDIVKNIVKMMGFKYGRTGLGPAYNHSDKLDINCTGVFGINYNLSNFIQDLDKLPESQFGVFCFHDINEENHHETTISCNVFKKCMDYLYQEHCNVVPLRDIERAL